MLFEPRSIVFLKVRIDPAFQRMQPKQMRRETMQRPDLRFLDIVEAGASSRRELGPRQPIPGL